jgi:hypothetical protein
LAPETKDPQVPSLQTNRIRCICFTFQPPGPLDFLLNDVSNMDRFNCKYCKWAKGSKEAIELNVFHSSCFLAYSLVVASLASTRSEGSCRPVSPGVARRPPRPRGSSAKDPFHLLHDLAATGGKARQSTAGAGHGGSPGIGLLPPAARSPKWPKHGTS